MNAGFSMKLNLLLNNLLYENKHKDQREYISLVKEIFTVKQKGDRWPTYGYVMGLYSRQSWSFLSIAQTNVSIGRSRSYVDIACESQRCRYVNVINSKRYCIIYGGSEFNGMSQCLNPLILTSDFLLRFHFPTLSSKNCIRWPIFNILKLINLIIGGVSSEIDSCYLNIRLMRTDAKSMSRTRIPGFESFEF